MAGVYTSFGNPVYSLREDMRRLHILASAACTKAKTAAMFVWIDKVPIIKKRHRYQALGDRRDQEFCVYALC